MPDEKDKMLWRMAQRRAQFRTSLFTYIVICGFLWGVWWFTLGRYQGIHGYPWPVWVMLAWGIGLAFQYFKAYHGDKENLTEEEYEKLKKQRDMSRNL